MRKYDWIGDDALQNAAGKTLNIVYPIRYAGAKMDFDEIEKLLKYLFFAELRRYPSEQDGVLLTESPASG